MCVAGRAGGDMLLINRMVREDLLERRYFTWHWAEEKASAIGRVRRPQHTEGKAVSLMVETLRRQGRTVVQPSREEKEAPWEVGRPHYLVSKAILDARVSSSQVHQRAVCYQLCISLLQWQKGPALLIEMFLSFFALMRESRMLQRHMLLFLATTLSFTGERDIW